LYLEVVEGGRWKLWQAIGRSCHRERMLLVKQKVRDHKAIGVYSAFSDDLGDEPRLIQTIAETLQMLTAKERDSYTTELITKLLKPFLLSFSM
jgi:hypothetical protein